jgi:hypothetical protein
MLTAPVFCCPPDPKSTGGDPLGLEAASQVLMGAVLSGMNNVVQYIRVYSLLCWASWQAARYCDDRGIRPGTVDRRMPFKRIQEKVQLVLNWAHLPYRGSVSLFGIQFLGFSTPSPSRPLTFADYGLRNPSYLAAGTYLPTLTSYFDFLRGSGALECTPAGVALAEAVDPVLASHPDYAWLADPNALSFNPDDGVSWLPHLDLRQPSKAEQQAFLNRFIPPAGETEEDNLDTSRRAGMMLVLRAVAAFQGSEQVGASEEDVRTTMVVGKAPDDRAVNLTDVALAQAKWEMLQLRQYERECLEALYAAVHQELDLDLRRGWHIEAIAHVLGEAGAAAHPAGPTVTVRERVDALHALRQTNATFASASWREPQLRLALRRELLLKAHPSRINGEVPLVAQAVEGLIFCAEEAANVEALPSGTPAHVRRKSCLQLQAERVPLIELRKLVADYPSRSFAELAVHCVRAYGIHRHLKIATQLQVMMNDDKNRARFIEADDGLRRCYEDDVLPSWEAGPDRLNRTLRLLEQCGLLTSIDDRYCVTAGAASYL